MGKINAGWHSRHPMPKNPTEGERLAWHLAHAKFCACRAIPDSLRALMAAQGIVEETRPA